MLTLNEIIPESYLVLSMASFDFYVIKHFVIASFHNVQLAYNTRKVMILNFLEENLKRIEDLFFKLPINVVE